MTSDASATNVGVGPPRFLDVFVVRSFRESHLEAVMRIVRQAVEDYESPYWRKGRPYRVVDTEQDLTVGEAVRAEVATKIANAAFTIVILDGLRLNILFELGLLYASAKPFALLKDRRWGPSFHEIDMLASDIKGVIVREFETTDPSKLNELLVREIGRCEREFVTKMGTHSILRCDPDNLVNQEWTFEPGHRHEPATADTGIVLRSFKGADLELVRHISTRSQFVVRFNLTRHDSAFTTYLRIRFLRGGRETSVWFGYSSATASGLLQHGEKGPVEGTIPLAVTGPGEYLLVDNIHKMVSQRVGAESMDQLIVEAIRLRGHDNSVTVVSEVKVTGC